MSQSFDSDALEAAIDRLVAGELDAEARRSLLLHLESRPDGWRRCALAFLEDQAWRSALGRPATAAVPAAAPAVVALPARRFGPSNPILRYAIAASLLATFAVGGFRAGVVSSRHPEPPLFVQRPSPPSPTGPGADDPAEPGRAIGYLSLVDPADGEAPPRQVPVLEATASNERWLAEQPASIPDYVKAQWERRGYQVEEHRRLVNLDLDDGRRVAIPVDEVALDYVGREPL